MLPYHRAEKFKEAQVESLKGLVTVFNRFKKQKRPVERQLGLAVRLDNPTAVKTVLSVTRKHTGSTLSIFDLVVPTSRAPLSNSLSAIFQSLNAFPALSSLTLNLTLWPDSSDFTFSSALPPLSTVKNLSLTHDVFAALALPPILASFPATDSSLTSLSLGSSPADNSSPVDHLLLRFTAVKHLHLGRSTSDKTTFADNLRALPSLSSLSFELGTKFDPSALSLLVNGPTRHPSFSHLTVDAVKPGKRGWKAAVPYLHSKHKQSRYHLSPGWERPGFESDSDDEHALSLGGMSLLMRACKEGGVRIEGTAVKAVGVYKAWLEEELLDEVMTEEIEAWEKEYDVDLGACEDYYGYYY
ncbi:hypothetical protein JCM8547_003815 [Rhodosporidiobolus lusitaniae]